MKISHRIDLIKKICARLTNETYLDGDLVLREFGLPTSRSWNDDPYSYYLKMTENAESHSLLEIHDYFFPNEPLPQSPVYDAGGRWKDGFVRFFLSHSSNNKLLAAQIKSELLQYGVDTFVAHEDIKATKAWLNEIRLAISSCHVFGALLCDGYSSSHYCDQEAGMALERRVLVIPILLQGKPHGFLEPIQAIKADGLSPKAVSGQIYGLISNHETTKQLAEKGILSAQGALINDFLASSDFATSSTLLKKIEALPTLELPLAKKLSKQWQKNDQIMGCRGIPDRMKRLLRAYDLVEGSRW